MIEVVLKRFEPPDEPHELWVIGDEPHVPIHIAGAADDARKSAG